MDDKQVLLINNGAGGYYIRATKSSVIPAMELLVLNSIGCMVYPSKDQENFIIDIVDTKDVRDNVKKWFNKHGEPVKTRG